MFAHTCFMSSNRTLTHSYTIYLPHCKETLPHTYTTRSRAQTPFSWRSAFRLPKTHPKLSVFPSSAVFANVTVCVDADAVCLLLSFYSNREIILCDTCEDLNGIYPSRVFLYACSLARSLARLPVNAVTHIVRARKTYTYGNEKWNKEEVENVRAKNV